LGFVCSFCGEQHDEEMLDIRAQFPDLIFELSDEERARRADLGDDGVVRAEVQLDPRQHLSEHDALLVHCLTNGASALTHSHSPSDRSICISARSRPPRRASGCAAGSRRHAAATPKP
jgi:hypothetical protein